MSFTLYLQARFPLLLQPPGEFLVHQNSGAIYGCSVIKECPILCGDLHFLKSMIAPEHRPSKKETMTFQSSIFRCELLFR